MTDRDAGSDSPETFDLTLKLRQRLQRENIQKERIQAQINAQTETLQRMFAQKPKRPRDSEERMDEKLIDLEYQRTKASLVLSEEKLILRQIDTIKKAKMQLAEYNAHERAIQEKKNELPALRDTLRTVIAAIAELEAALSKVELANRLGCTTAELQTRVVDCPEGKLGFVIGKNGATIKQLEEQTGVHVDIDKVGSKVHLHGSESALEAAVAEVEKITLAITEDIELPPAALSFLLIRRTGVFSKLQSDHPKVYFDLSKENSLLKLRGKPEDVGRAKNDVDSLDVTSRTKEISQREASSVVGKGGATVTNLVEKHSVIFNISNEKDAETASVEVIGLEANVDSAFADVEDILFQNGEVEEFVMVRPMLRNKFLMNSAAVVKELQGEVSGEISGGGGVLLVFERRAQSRDEPAVPSKLIIKTSRANSEKAKEVVQRRIDAFEANVLAMTVDPDIVPAILGKGGETINALRQEGSGADIDIDRLTGAVNIHSEEEETREAVKTAIEKIVSENQVKKVAIEKTMIGLLLGEPGKDMRQEVSEAGASLSVDPSDKYMVLRGREEEITGAAKIVQEFIDCNYVEEYEVHPDDHGLLLQGGADSPLKKLEADHDVTANVRKAMSMLVVRGKRENVEAALVDIKRFLLGGDGFAVCKMKVPDGLLGVIIGKGGSNISKLESENDGLNIQAIGDSNLLCIRGPEDNVEQCRAQVISQLATTKIIENVLITSDQYDSLNQWETLRKITSATGVTINLAETLVKIRGVSADVRDAKALLQDHLTGTYEQAIELEPSQLNRVRAAVKDPSHFERIRDATQTELSLDSVNGAILISGKRSNVKRAKILVLGFLDFLLPSEFAKFKVARPLLKSMGDPSELAKIAADSGASISVDRDLSAILVRSSDPDQVEQAVELLKARMEDCEKLVYVERFDHSDAWLLPIIIGKGGATIQNMQKENDCSIDVSKEELTVAISGKTEESVEKAKDAFNRIIEKARKECVFIDLPESALPAFIGKAGSNIKQLSEDYNVEIERVRKEPSRIQIKGNELSVKNAGEAVSSWLQEWEGEHEGVSFQVEESVIPVILGKGGAVINGIQNDHNVKVDINRRSLIITVRGGQRDHRDEAAREIQQIAYEHMARIAEQEDAQQKADVEAAEARISSAAARRGDNARAGTTASQEIEGRKDRSKEFAAIPVGLTVVESKPNKPKKQKNKQKASSVNFSAGATSAGQSLFNMIVSGPSEVVKHVRPTPSGGTDAGQSLFNMLVTENSPVMAGQMSPSRSSPPALVDEQWDSSTVSSGTKSSEADNYDENLDTVIMDKSSSFYKSASGFNVRV